MDDSQTDIPPLPAPELTNAWLDAPRSIVLRFSQRIPVGDLRIESLKVFAHDGGELEPRTLRAMYDLDGWCDMFLVAVRRSLGFGRRTYEVEAAGYGRAVVRPRKVLRDKRYFFDPDIELGAIYTPEETTFRVFAPTAFTAHVVIADGAAGYDGVVEHDMHRWRHGVFEATVPGDLKGKFYAYKLSGTDLDPAREVPDIHAVCMQNRHPRSLIVDLKETDPPGFRDRAVELPAEPTDAVIYEMHVRDFTIAGCCGAQHKGQFLGLTETGTHLPDDPDTSTCLDHLVELGVTHVQLMPVQDFDNDETGNAYRWGYMPACFNSPDGWYASQVDGPSRIIEFKRAVQAFHERGIGVIMDVVYNHTAGCAGFDKLVPGYYYRVRDDGVYCNGSGCGNEFASEHPMARKFILDSLKFWAREYRVDGFRFDLMGLIDLQTMKQALEELRTINPRIMLYGEPWAGGYTPLQPITEKRFTRGTGIGAFYDGFRDAIKGSTEGGSPGFVQAGLRGVDVVKGLMGGVHDWSAGPADAINYFEAHDNLTTWDKLVLSVPDGSDLERRRMMRMAHLILLTSQGVVFLHAGQEFCRSKLINRNSYNAPDAINMVNWRLKRDYRDVYDYVRWLIALRKAHPMLRLRSSAEIERRTVFFKPPTDRCVTYMLKGEGLEGETARGILVLLNGENIPVTVYPPPGPWVVHADADRFDDHPILTVREHVTLPPHSGMLLIR